MSKRKPTPKREIIDPRFSWQHIWKTPMGVFMVVVIIGLATVTTAFLAFREDITQRRIVACESSNAEARRTRTLWQRIFDESEGVRPGFVIFPTPDKKTVRLPIQFDRTDPKQIEAFRKFINETYPINVCDGRTFLKVPPAPSIVPSPTGAGKEAE